MSKTSHKKHILTSSLLVLLLVFVPLVASADWAQNTLYTFVANVSGMFTWIGGMLLDIAIGNFVVGFGGLFENSGLGYSVNSLWTVVRDIFNLTFVFGIVFIGFKMILNADDSSARKNLISLIMAALLVNFSLYITKVVVDFSNLAAMQLATGFLDTATGKYDVSQSFMNLLGISSLWDVQEIPTGQNGWGFIIGTLIINLVAAFVFFAGGLLLMIRFAVLNIYMILSPVMFLGMVFPGFMSTSRDFWNGFMKRAFFAPAYILMLFLANQVLVNMNGVSGGAGIGKVFSAEKIADARASFEGTIPFFILTAVFLVAAIVVGQKMGAQGATTAAAIGRRWTDKTRQTLVNRPAAAVGRGAAAVGGGVYSLGASPVRNKINNLGSGIEKSFKNYQAKAAATDASSRGGLQKFALSNVATRAADKTADNLRKAQLGTGTTKEAEEAYTKKTMSRAAQTTAENKRAADFSTNYKNLTDSTKSATLSAAALGTALDDLGKAIKGMTKEEKNGLSIEQLKDKSVAVNLTDDDIKNFESSGNFSAAEIQNIKDAKKHGLRSIATHGNTLTKTDAAGNVIDYSIKNAGIHNSTTKTGKPATLEVDKRQSITSRGVADVGAMPTEIFTTMEMYEHLTPQMINEKIKKGGFGNDQKKVVTAINDYLLTQTNNLNVLNAWGRWAKEDSNGIKMGITIPPTAVPVTPNAAPAVPPLYTKLRGSSKQERA